MNISWNYDNEINSARVITDTGMELTIDFNSVGGVDIMCNGGQDFYPDTITANNLYLKINDEYITITELAKRAESEYDDMVSEAEEEDRNTASHIADLRDLKFTGRV